MMPFYTEGYGKLVRKAVWKLYGKKEDDDTIITLRLTPWQNIWYNNSRGDEYNQARGREEDLARKKEQNL
jgi:hypothetical protein